MHQSIINLCKRRKEAHAELAEVVHQALIEYREGDHVLDICSPIDFLGNLDEKHVCIYLRKEDIKTALASRGIIRNTWQKFLRWLF